MVRVRDASSQAMPSHRHKETVFALNAVLLRVSLLEFEMKGPAALGMSSEISSLTDSRWSLQCTDHADRSFGGVVGEALAGFVSCELWLARCRWTFSLLEEIA